MAVGASTVWRLRTGGDDTNGAAYDGTISGAGTDYSQQDAAQLSLTDLVCQLSDDAGRLKLRSATGGFTSAMIGNAIRILSTGSFTAGYYFVTGYDSTNLVTLDRSPAGGADRTGGSGKLGGAARNFSRFYKESNATGDKPVAGNTIWARGDGSDFPTSTHYTETAGWYSPPRGDTTNGYIKIKGENGRPRIEYGNSLWFYSATNPCTLYQDLYFIANASTGVSPFRGEDARTFVGCVFDGNNRNSNFITIGNGNVILFCEFFSHPTAPTAQSSAIALSGDGWFSCTVAYNNIHHMGGAGISVGNSWGWTIFGNLIHHCKGNGITASIGGSASYSRLIAHNTIDANEGHGIELTGSIALQSIFLVNNIISNHTQASKYGLSVAGTQSLNDNLAAGRCKNNAFYNNTAHRNGVSAFDGDIDGTNPSYVDAANGDYRIGTALKALGFPTADYVHAPSGSRSYTDIGALQRAEPASGSGGAHVLGGTVVR